MTHRTNAGIRRNRRPAGSKAVERLARLSPEAAAALDAACLESGNISPGLYLEQLIRELIVSQGHLPVFAPQLDIAEEAHPPAA